MGYAVVINSLTLSGCTPQVYFPVLQIHLGLGSYPAQLSSMCTLSIPGRFKLLAPPMNMSLKDLHARRKKRAEEARIDRIFTRVSLTKHVLCPPLSSKSRVTKQQTGSHWAVKVLTTIALKVLDADLNLTDRAVNRKV